MLVFRRYFYVRIFYGEANASEIIAVSPYGRSSSLESRENGRRGHCCFTHLVMNSKSEL